jgi:nucleotide-binding universal stress UspA family protein
VTGSIVLGYDGSESAKAALEETTRVAAGLGAKVDVVFAYHVNPLGGLQEGTIGDSLKAIGEEHAGHARAALEAAGVEVESHIVSGRPAEVILLVAERVGASMIAVGTVGEGAITGALLGSVVLKLVQQATLPLLVVPAK